MENLFEIIVPLIFAAIYFFGNMLSGKSDDEAPGSAPRRREEDPDAAERQRRIQEEIRRKIMERRNQAEGQGAPPASQHTSEADKSLSERRAAVEERRRQRELARQRPEPVEGDRGSPHPRHERRTSQSGSAPDAESVFSWEKSDNTYSNQMEERLQEIEATKRRAEKLQKQAKASRQKLKDTDASTTRLRGRSREARRPVRATLRDPAAARAAFIYGEVLGPPVSMKKAPTVPGLQ